jgi:hypothetical protein
LIDTPVNGSVKRRTIIFERFRYARSWQLPPLTDTSFFKTSALLLTLLIDPSIKTDRLAHLKLVTRRRSIGVARSRCSIATPNRLIQDVLAATLNLDEIATKESLAPIFDRISRTQRTI